MHTDIPFSGTIREDTGKPINTGMDLKGTYGWILIAFLAFGVPWGIWSIFVLFETSGSQLLTIVAMMGCFVMLAIGYLGLVSPRRAAWFSIPVILTIVALLEFIFLPACLFATGTIHADYAYVRAMFLTLIGFTAFWAGSLVFMKENSFRFVPRIHDRSSRVAYMSAIMLGVGLGTKIVLWKAGLYSRAADAEALVAAFPFLQWLNFLSDLLEAALWVSGIEMFGKQSTVPLIRIVFWTSFVSSLGFALISGGKGAVVYFFLSLVIIYSFTKARIPRWALLLPLLPVMIYPFSDAYRNNLYSSSRSQDKTIEGEWSVIIKSFGDALNSHSTVSGITKEGFDKTASRLSLLTDVHNVVNLPDLSVLIGVGDARIWEAPFYPLVPRFIWKNKPVLIKGLRLYVALGNRGTSWSALTPIGDLYSMYGTLGVVIGMFIYGTCMQLYMNRVAHKAFSERKLFIYIEMLVLLTGFELDVTTFVAGVVQLGIVVLTTSYIIYGRPVPSLRIVRRPDPNPL
jgi:hypothetical protein